MIPAPATLRVRDAKARTVGFRSDFKEGGPQLSLSDLCTFSDAGSDDLNHTTR
jgi:hypothetical protein